MGIENFKRWQWIVMGVLFGCLLAGAQYYFHDYVLEFFSRGDAVSSKVFENLVESRLVGVGPLVQNIKIYHRHEGGYLLTFDVSKSYGQIIPANQQPTGKPRDIKIPTGQRVVDMAETKAGLFVAPESFVPWSARTASTQAATVDKSGTIITYLSRFPEIDWKVPWTEKPHARTIAWIAGTTLVIGGIWPFILALLIKMGLHPAPRPKETYDLKRFKPEAEEEKKQAATVTQEDMDHLLALEAELEKNLAAGAVAREAAPATTVAAPVVRKLDGKAAATAAAVEAAARDKAFGTDQTDFYPTEVHGKKKE